MKDVFLTVVPRPHANVANYDFEIFQTELEEKWSVKAAQIAVSDIIRKGIQSESKLGNDSVMAEKTSLIFKD